LLNIFYKSLILADNNMKNAFEVNNPDFKLSPYTGMTKKHYIECAKYIGILRVCDDFDKFSVCAAE